MRLGLWDPGHAAGGASASTALTLGVAASAAAAAAVAAGGAAPRRRAKDYAFDSQAQMVHDLETAGTVALEVRACALREQTRPQRGGASGVRGRGRPCVRRSLRLPQHLPHTRYLSIASPSVLDFVSPSATAVTAVTAPVSRC